MKRPLVAFALLFPVVVFADAASRTGRIIRPQELSKRIPGLTVLSREIPIMSEESDPDAEWVIVDLEFDALGRTLVAGDKSKLVPKTPNRQSSFSLRVPLRQGKVTPARLVAVEGSGQIREETLLIVVDLAKPRTSPPKPLPAEATATTHLAVFRIGAAGSFQSEGGNDIGPELTWNPSFRFTNRLGAYAEIGAMIFRREGGYFLALQTQLLLASTLFSRLEIQLGGGAETWIAYGGTRGMASANLSARLNADLGLCRLTGLLLGISYIFDEHPIYQPRLGAILSF